MHTTSVARTYAEALLQIAQTGGRIDAVGDELQAVASVLGGGELRAFLESPAIADADKKAALEHALGGAADAALVDFLCLLVDKQRIGELDAIAGAYRDLADVASNRQRVRVTSAVPLPDDLQARVAHELEAKLRRTCVLETEVRPDILAGLVLTIGDKVYDGSVRSQLRRLQKEMMKSSGYED